MKAAKGWTVSLFLSYALLVTVGGDSSVVRITAREDVEAGRVGSSHNVRDAVVLSWEAFGDGKYTVQVTGDLVSGAWHSLPGTWPIGVTKWVDSNVGREVERRFYRVESAGVYTAPAAGFVRVPASRNGLTMMSVPLWSSDARLNGDPGCVGDTLKKYLCGGPAGAAADFIYKWDPGEQKYKRTWLIGGTGKPDHDGKWWDDDRADFSDITLDVGDCFWLRRRNTGPETVLIMFLGGVPYEETKTIRFVRGQTMFCWPYPTVLALNDSTLADIGAGGPDLERADVVSGWDLERQEYVKAFLLGGTGGELDGTWFNPGPTPPPGPSEIQFEPGAAFWYERRSAEPAVWVCHKPY